MKSLKFLKIFNENFGAKVFVKFAVLIFVVSFSFTAFFIHHQSRSLKETMIKEGRLLASLLAYSTRLGVFSENESLLRDPVEGILQQEEVREVLVFNLEGRLLKKKAKPVTLTRKGAVKGGGDEQPGNIFERLKESRSSLYLESDDKFEFWAPVISGSGYSTEESLFFKEEPPRRENRIIGFVGIKVGKEMLNKRLWGLLLKSILMAIIFLMLGSLVTYLVVRGVTRPLDRLTRGVKALGTGGSVEKVPVETEDEIGKLAMAFNNMAESLKRREAEKEMLEEQLRHAQKMEAIGTLSGGIAHDFNNILTAIIGYANLLQIQIEKDTPARYYVEQILASTARAANLTQSLLAFSRKQIINPEPVDLNEIIRNVEKLLVRLIGEDIELRTELSERSLIVMADFGQIEQVLMNLATNARDAMPEGGVLTITTEPVELERELFSGSDYVKPGRYALMSVMDTGTGIDEKIKERIFDPFFTTKEVGKGTGLGLSMVYGIVKQHKGYIIVDNIPGKGTTFMIYLSLIESKIEREDAAPLPELRGGTESVLMAEDDEDVRRLSRDMLQRYGYKVIEAIDGEDAVKKFIENDGEIQILLLDVIMPKKNGKEAYEEIKKIRPDIKALFISGYASDIMHKRGVLGEGINLISKPVSPEELLRKIRETLDR